MTPVLAVPPAQKAVVQKEKKKKKKKKTKKRKKERKNSLSKHPHKDGKRKQKKI
jgi:hypothetical protein